MAEIKIGFIGCGNMGSALIGGALKVVSPQSVNVYDIDEAKAAALKEEYGLNILSSEDELIEHSEIVILAVKPQYLNETAVNISASLEGKLIISILAGKSSSSIRSALAQNADYSIVRVMPNTPALIGEGMSALSFEEGISESEKEFVRAIFNGVGKVIEVEEEKMDIITACSGSGPAYLFKFIEAAADTAAKNGIEKAEAQMLMAQTFLGAAKLLIESKESAETLRRNVTSKGGTTEAALKAFDEKGFNEIVAYALEKAKARSEELKA